MTDSRKAQKAQKVERPYGTDRTDTSPQGGSSMSIGRFFLATRRGRVLVTDDWVEWSMDVPLAEEVAVSRDGLRITVRCPYCNRGHTHGNAFGGRAAHCHSGPYTVVPKGTVKAAWHEVTRPRTQMNQSGLAFRMRPSRKPAQEAPA